MRNVVTGAIFVILAGVFVFWPKLGWAIALAVVPVLYTVTIMRSLSLGQARQQATGEYVAGAMLANCVGWSLAIGTHRVSLNIALIGVVILAVLIGLAASPERPSRSYLRLRGLSSRYGQTLGSLGKDVVGQSKTVDPVGCAVAIVFGLCFGVAVVGAGIVIELILVPVGLLIFGTIALVGNRIMVSFQVPPIASRLASVALVALVSAGLVVSTVEMAKNLLR